MIKIIIIIYSPLYLEHACYIFANNYVVKLILNTRNMDSTNLYKLIIYKIFN